MYADEIKPGNVLRPDKGREQLCFYWTLKELPSWFVSRDQGWFFFGCFPTSMIGNVAGGYSFLFSLMVECFFDLQQDKLNFGTGIPLSKTSGSFVFKPKFGFFLADAKALKQLWNLSGENGTKPCFCCANVVGRIEAEGLVNHEYLVHVSSCEQDRFQLHTPETGATMVRDLAALAGRPAEQKKLGQVCGLQYHENGALWHPRLQLNHISQTMYDWMHVLVTSSAVGQYQVNEFAKELKQSWHVSLEYLDHFAQTFQLPACYTALPKKFFRDRVCMEANSCIRCFGSEMLVAVRILVALVQTVLDPAGVLPEHCRCMKLLGDILDILSSSVASPARRAVALEEAVSAHRPLFAELYPDCRKPKFHWLHHVPAQVRKFD
ncbi:unnamed protein product, partial [Symbiodinium necroappetens]